MLNYLFLETQGTSFAICVRGLCLEKCSNYQPLYQMAPKMNKLTISRFQKGDHFVSNIPGTIRVHKPVGP